MKAVFIEGLKIRHGRAVGKAQDPKSEGMMSVIGRTRNKDMDLLFKVRMITNRTKKIYSGREKVSELNVHHSRKSVAVSPKK